MVGAAVAMSSCNNFDYGDCSTIANWVSAKVEADYNLKWEIPVTPRTDWSHAWPDSFGMTYRDFMHPMPEGLRMTVFNTDHSTFIVNMDPEGGLIQIREGVHDVLFYNNNTRYIVFRGLNHFLTATATTRNVMRATYTGCYAVGTDSDPQPTVTAPDMLFLDSYLGLNAKLTPGSQLVIDAQMEPAVYTYYIRFNIIKGLEHVALARGALTGMASEVLLSEHRTLSAKATILYDCTVDSSGVWASVNSFGVADYTFSDEHPEAVGRYGVTLELLLDNGKIVQRHFDVSPQVRVQPMGGVIMVGDIEVTDAESAPGTGGGFDVSVEDWGEANDIIIDL